MVSEACNSTEYKETYRQYSRYEPVKPIIHDVAYKPSSQPLEDSTTSKREFIPHDVKPRWRRERETFKQSDKPLYSDTSYKHDFFEKKGEKAVSCKPFYLPVLGEPFSVTTRNQETYKQWELPPKDIVVPPQTATQMPTGVMDTKSTFQDDYPGHVGCARRKIMLQRAMLEPGPGKMEDESTTMAEYTQKSAKLEQPKKYPDHDVQPRGPFDPKTTMQHAYQWSNGKPALKCQPQDAPNDSSAPLESETTHNTMFKQWEIPKAVSWKPTVKWSAPHSPFNHSTTFQRDYLSKTGLPAKSAQPIYVRPTLGDFDETTTNQATFKAWKIKPTMPLKPPSTFNGSKSKFEGQTTFQDHFQGLPSVRPDLCIPKEGVVISHGDSCPENLTPIDSS